MSQSNYVKNLSPRGRVLYWASWALPIIAAWCYFLLWFNTHYTIALNRSSSLAGSIFLIEKTGQIPSKGELVAINPGPTPVYPWHVVSVKVLAGVPGDKVTQTDRTFFINGQKKAVAKSISKLGYPLAPGPTGVLPRNHYWVYTESPDSYDSRYRDIGWVSKEKIVGPAYVLL